MGLSHSVSSKVITRKGNQHFRVAAVSMQGLRDHMEDAHVVLCQLERHPDTALFGVFDGHSGQSASDYTAKRLPVLIDSLEVLTPETIQQVVLQLDREFMEQPSAAGTTATFCVVQRRERNTNNTNSLDGLNLPQSDSPESEQQNHPQANSDNNRINNSQQEAEPSNNHNNHHSHSYDILVFNVGDSRILLGKADKTVFPLTADHKPQNLEEAQRIRRAKGFVSQGRVDGTLAVSRAIGDKEFKCNAELGPTEQKVISLPDWTSVKIDTPTSDFLFLCCDGLFERMTNEEVIGFVREQLDQDPSADPANVISRLIDHSLQKGSQDNMTGVLVQFQDGKDYNQDEDEFIPGPFNDKWGRDFQEAYARNAEQYGYSLREALAMLNNQKIQEQPQIAEPQSLASSPLTLVADPLSEQPMRDLEDPPGIQFYYY